MLQIIFLCHSVVCLISRHQLVTFLLIGFQVTLCLNDKYNLSNYRPINLTSVIIKILSAFYLDSALEHHHVLSPSQSGFRNKRSTVTLLTEETDDWSQCLEQRSTVHCLLLDFAEAFDSVPHERLLIKLEIRGEILTLLRFFLTKQRVVINGAFSDWASVTYGVPQGTVLGPLLFLLYANDLESVVKYSTIKLFSDDALLYAAVNTTKDCSAFAR